MQTVTLAWTNAGSQSQSFNVYSVNPYGVHIFKSRHEGIAGQRREHNVGYRRKIQVEFAPLLNDKALAYKMMSFVFGTLRSITYEAITYDVTFDDTSLVYSFMQNTKFANMFSLTFIERSLSTITDTLSTRVLKPLYSTSNQGIVSETLSIYSNLVDDVSVDIVKTNLTFIDDNRSDASFAYAHALTLDIGLVNIATYRTWLIEFCLWTSKQIDTTAIDAVNGKVYNVIYDDTEIDFTLESGIKDATSCILRFREKDARQTVEAVDTHVWDEVVFDETVAQ